MTLAATFNAWEADLDRILDKITREPVTLEVKIHPSEDTWRIVGSDGKVYASRFDAFDTADAFATQLAHRFGALSYRSFQTGEYRR